MITSNVRIPEDIWYEIKKIAEEEERSINSQIIYILRKFLEERAQEQLDKIVKEIKKED